jgi:hypothetical protein
MEEVKLLTSTARRYCKIISEIAKFTMIFD